MSQEVATRPEVKPTPLGHAWLDGRISAVRRETGQRGTFYLTLLVLPAADKYSSPQIVEITSSNRLGDRENDWAGFVKIGGYRRTYNKTDRDTGETKVVSTADVRLEAVEA